MNDENLEDCTVEAALYALGALPVEKASAVEQRLRSGCEFCLAQVERYAAVAEQLSLAVKPVEPSSQLRQRLLDRIEVRDKTAEPSEHMKLVRANDAPWVKMPFPGVEIRPLIGNKTLMVRMAAGALFPEHDHPQAEQCYVLEGSLTDSDGVTVYAGDFVVVSAGIKHAKLHSVDGCTLLIAYAD